MMFVILFVAQLEPFVDKGPLWQQHLDGQTCDEYWWTNLLYINNFYPTNAKDSVSKYLTRGWFPPHSFSVSTNEDNFPHWRPTCLVDLLRRTAVY